MDKKYLLPIIVLVLIFLIPVLVNLVPAPAKHLEVYDVKEEDNCRICYLRWHGFKTELKIYIMGDAPYGTDLEDPAIVNNGDTFTVSFNKYNGWSQIYYDDKMVVVRNIGVLEEYP